MPERSRIRPHDPAQLAKLVVDTPPAGKNQTQIILGRHGDLEGGKARAIVVEATTGDRPRGALKYE
jgi:hypothetical protein